MKPIGFLLCYIIAFSQTPNLYSQMQEERAPFAIMHPDNGAGMFALFSTVLGCLRLYEKRKAFWFSSEF